MAILPSELKQFVILHQDVEAVLQRCGRETFDLVLIDVDGNWDRWVFTSEEQAEAAAASMDVSVHHGWDDRMTKRMNRRDHWNEPGGQHRAL